MKSKYYFRSLTSLFLIPFFLISSINTPSFSASPAAAPGSVKAVCRIEVGDAHISSSILKHKGVHVVKVNAISICNAQQNQVTLTLEIYKVGEFSDHLMHRAVTNPALPSSRGLKVRIQDAKVECINSRPSSYYGIVYGKAIIQGTWHYAGKTRSVHIVQLLCGN
jgi:hypothetical protein